MNLAFIWPLRHAGLALAIGLGACLNAGLPFRKLRQQGIYRPQPGWRMFWLKGAAALLAMGAVLWFGAGPDVWWLEQGSRERILRLSWLVAAGGASYFAALWLLGFRLRDFSRQAAR